MNSQLMDFVGAEVASPKQQGTFRAQRILQSEQGGRAIVDGRSQVMLGSSNYLGLASHPKVKEAVKQAVDRYGSGTASVSEVCGLTDLHYELRGRIPDHTGIEAALLYPSCSTANMGVIDGRCPRYDLEAPTSFGGERRGQGSERQSCSMPRALSGSIGERVAHERSN